VLEQTSARNKEAKSNEWLIFGFYFEAPILTVSVPNCSAGIEDDDGMHNLKPPGCDTFSCKCTHLTKVRITERTDRSIVFAR